ncbi:hypothetical protein GX48_04131 [Paracoccidioides brasiliensis]|nr:hypothetical protein GX48_04131 [Paracoccidioides brasiliensis]
MRQRPSTQYGQQLGDPRPNQPLREQLTPSNGSGRTSGFPAQLTRTGRYLRIFQTQPYAESQSKIPQNSPRFQIFKTNPGSNTSESASPDVFIFTVGSYMKIKAYGTAYQTVRDPGSGKEKPTSRR